MPQCSHAKIIKDTGGVKVEKRKRLPSTLLQQMAKPFVGKLGERMKNINKTLVPDEVPESKRSKGDATLLGDQLLSTMELGSRFEIRKMLFDEDTVEDIGKYLRYLELVTALPFSHLYNRSINGQKREELVDMLVEMQMEFQLFDETLQLAVGMMDRALIRLNEVKCPELLAYTCLWTAAKFEQIYIPQFKEFEQMTGCSQQDIIQMEQVVLRAIDFKCGVPTPVQFIRQYFARACAPEEIQHLAQFVSEVGIRTYSLCYLKPSRLAAVAFYLAAVAFKFPLSDGLLADMMRDCQQAHCQHRTLRLLGRQFIIPVLELNGPNTRHPALRHKYREMGVKKFDADQATRLMHL